MKKIHTDDSDVVISCIDVEENRRGEKLAEVLGIHPEPGRGCDAPLYHTTLGIKNGIGLYEIAKRIIEEGRK